MKLKIIMQLVACILTTIWCIYLYFVNDPFWQTVAVFDIGLIAVLAIYYRMNVK